MIEVISILIASLAFGLSCYTFFVHDRRIKKQEKLLKEYQLRSLAQSEDEGKKAIIRAKSVMVIGGKRTLYIYNTGKAKARNVIIEMPNSDEIYASSTDFPLSYKELLPDAYREVTLLLSEGDDELTLNYKWEDDYSKENKETQTIDL